MYLSGAYLISAYSTVWYGMYLSGAYLVSPPLYLTPLYICPPSTPPSTYASSSKAAPSSSSTSTSQPSINFFHPPPDTFLSRKAGRSLDRNCFSIWNFFAAFCSSESLHGGFCGRLLVLLNWRHQLLTVQCTCWLILQIFLTFAIYLQTDKTTSGF